MNFTFIIGNGFDINLGLRTKYTDFYEYIKKNNLLESNIFFEKIREDIKYWEDFEKMLGIMTCFDKDISLFMKRINQCHLNIGSEEVENLAKHLLGDGTKAITWKKYNKDLKEFYTEFRKYLELEEKRIEISDKENSRRITNSLLHFWEDFEEDEQKKFFENIDEAIKQQNMGWNVFDSSSSEETFSFSFEFLNFNYSSTLENMLQYLDLEFLGNRWSFLIKKKLKKNVKVKININHYHVHANKNTGMFLGVDNHFQLNEKFFPNIDMMDTIIKPYKIDDYVDGNTDNYKNILVNSDYIYIFGMSVGITDLTWWKVCIELIKNNPVKIVIHYFENDFRIDIGDYEYTLNKDKVRKILLRYDESFEDIMDRSSRRKIKNKIIPVSNSQIMFNDKWNEISVNKN
ncbi:AbiH family protein [Carnobacterium maltaromaticum]|uniref:AbiH family protein n=1 Tax=Carnobacterium maltaromaticum TaxID=2751 RepID=UPI0039BEC4EC